MTPARRLLVLLSAALIAAVAAVPAVMLPVGTASAHAASAAGTRVGAHHSGMILDVGVSHRVSPGQGRCGRLREHRIAAGACVAPEDASGVLKTVYRFHDASDPASLQSRLASAEPDVQAKVASQLESPGEVARLAEAHMQGFVENSPFVSVTDDRAAAAASTDPWLRTIATGEPGVPGVAPAPNLSKFSVPVSRLIAPSNALSISEGEYLFQGDDLINYLVETRPNPFGGG